MEMTCAQHTPIALKTGSLSGLFLNPIKYILKLTDNPQTPPQTSLPPTLLSYTEPWSHVENQESRHHRRGPRAAFPPSAIPHWIRWRGTVRTRPSPRASLRRRHRRNLHHRL